jgi:hypothetical protein
MPAIPEGKTAFEVDTHNMGIRIGRNCLVMFDCTGTQECKYVIVVNITTGERLRVAVAPEGINLGFIEGYSLVMGHSPKTPRSREGGQS